MTEEENYIDKKVRVRMVKTPQCPKPNRSFLKPKKNNEHIPQTTPDGRLRVSDSKGGGRRKAYASTKGHSIKK